MKSPAKTVRGVLLLSTGMVVAAALLASGCATKKYVAAQIAPVQAGVQSVDAKAEANAKSITDLGEKMRREIARLEETEEGLEGEVRSVAGEAKKANELAASAKNDARDARALAERGLAGIDRLEGNLGNYTLLGEETVYFARSRSNLDEAARKAISRLIAKLEGDQYLFEVLGFADSTGPDELNLALSRKRADAVVRELVVEHKIPVRHIHNLGLGKDEPVAENKTAAGRKQNRRVEIRLYRQELKEEGAAPARVSQLR